MRKLSIISLIALVAIVVTSCGSSNNVVSNGIISKRKYTKGFFLNRKSDYKTAKNDVKEADLKDDKAIAKTEKIEARKERKLKNAISEPTVAQFEQTTVADIESNTVATEAPVRTESSNFSEDGYGGDFLESQPIEIKESEEVAYENRQETAKKNEMDQNSNSDIIFVLAVIFAILIPPLGVAIYTNIDWVKVLIALLLTILFVLPGIIYALLVVFDVI